MINIKEALISSNKNKDYFPQSVASGDPKANSVILWTRYEEQGQSVDTELVVQIAKDKAFKNLVISTKAEVLKRNDGCLKIKAKDLEPYHYYYYRFLKKRGEEYLSSNIGRTKTAPSEDMKVDVSFAQASCQDYIGRYYNLYHSILKQDDLDFVVFLGDYIYETTRDPRFQNDSGRTITFEDQANAIALGEGDGRFYSARSLNNYRQLYQVYRADELLQKVHESFPMIMTWDDHEFSDDSYGITATFSKGKADDSDLQRKLNSERAYYEYMPLDLDDNDFVSQIKSYNAEDNQYYPETKIYRNFNFGKNLDLWLTDFRTNRPDHLIPEDAFPGTILFTQTVLKLLLASQGIEFESIKNSMMPYIDIEDKKYKEQKDALVKVLENAYQREGLRFDEARLKAIETISGNLSVPIINHWLERYNNDKPKEDHVFPLSLAEQEELPVGFCYALLGKLELFGEIGSRYFVVKKSFDLLAAATHFINKKTQDGLGKHQELWLKDQVLGSRARWKFIANSVSMNSYLLDLTDPKLGIPAPLNQNFYFNLDHWDGMPNKRKDLLETFSKKEGVVLLSGDLHACLIGRHGNKIKEFTVPSITSSTQRDMIKKAVKGNEFLQRIPKLNELLERDSELVLSANQKLEYAEMNMHGIFIYQVSSDSIKVSLHKVSSDMVSQSYYGEPKSYFKNVVIEQFELENGSLRQL